MMMGLAFAVVAAAVGADRLTDIASVPVLNEDAWIGYVGSIDPSGGNADWDWGEVQDENGEWVLFEDFGPGCVYNFTQHRGETVEVPTFRFYFDGEKTPRLTVRPKDFGEIPELPRPLAGAFCATEHNRPFRIVRSFVPMEYEKGCRITSSVKLRGCAPSGGWGHVMYHRYRSAKGLRTYDPKRDVSALAARFRGRVGLAAKKTEALAERTLAPGESVRLHASDRKGTLVETALAVKGFGPSTVTNLWLVYEFDGRKTVEAPLGTFFGCETPGRPAKLETALLTFDTSDKGQARFSNRFPMPYFASCRVWLENRSKAPVAGVSASVGSDGSLEYDRATTGIFTAAPYRPKTRNVAGRNAHIGSFAGRGIMAYGTITGWDYESKKYGWGTCEGDVRCFIDDMTVPRIQSDGSESWGSWGWGFCAPPQVNPFSAYHSWRGHELWSEVRLTYADSYPFRRFLRFDLEHGTSNNHPESATSGQVFGYVLPKVPEYAAADGGFAIEDGTAEFSRPLYGWHGNDEMKKPVKPIMWASDRPRVRLSCHPPKRQNPDLGTLSFGDGAERVRFAYVRGRAEYELKDRGTVTLVRSVGSDDLLAKVTGGLKPAFDGEWIQRGAAEKDGAAYYAFARKGCKDAPVADLPKAFADGCARLDRISRAIETKTPDARFDALVACQNVAADALFEGPIICHGATGWHCAYGGWRGAYAAVALGWDEAFKANARLYFKAQKPDGRIPCQPWREGIYNMNEVFVDAVLRYWLRSGDDAFLMECAYEGVKGHLRWMERTMKDPTTGLFENWLDAWNTDNKWCNGGAGTIATAYTLFAYETMAKAAVKLGRTEDAKAFAARAAEIRSLVDTWLWSAEKGVWGEYRERFGRRRLNDCPDTSTIYTAIDSGLAAADPARAASALAWIERNVPSVILGDGTSMILSSHKLPLFYSTCGRYAQETMHLALAYWLVGEPEIAARHFRGAICGGWRGESAGPGALATTYTETLTNDGSTDFGDTVGIFLRTVVEGVFGIRVDAPSGTVTVVPGFPSDWDRASIRTPYLAYDWTRADGVKVTANPHGWRVRVAPPAPKLVGERLPKPHCRWGSPKGEGTDTSVASDARFEHVDLSAAFNQNWRTLHVREYGPRISDFAFNDWTPPRTLTAHGRSWWESPNSSDEESNVRGGRNVPDKMAWPADGIVKSKTGIPFRLAGHDAKNAAFVSLYEQFPDRLEIPLSGKASKLALLTALSTNPNQDWMEAARFAVAYADGTSEVLPLVPPDNCDDWLNYLQGRPYHLTGEHVMFHKRAHANVLAMRLDPAKELKSLTLECVGTETFAGLVAATLVRCVIDNNIADDAVVQADIRR